MANSDAVNSARANVELVEYKRRSMNVRRMNALPLQAAALLLFSACMGRDSASNAATLAGAPAPADSAASPAASSSGASDRPEPRGAEGAGAPAAQTSPAGSGGALQPAAGASGMVGASPAAGTVGPAAVNGGDSGSQSIAAGAGGGAGVAAPAAGAPAVGPFELKAVTVTDLGAGEVAFPADALPPTNQSPGFEWSGVPAHAKSLALVFTDVSGGAVKWVVWDIPPSVNRLPAGISTEANPSEVPGSSQIGSLGNQGYAGPCCVNNRYEFVLWALDVAMLPGAERASTYAVRDLIQDHDLARTAPVKMRIMR